MPRHFSKVMSNPYFQTDFYKNQTPGGKFETKVENKLSAIKNKVISILKIKRKGGK